MVNEIIKNKNKVYQCDACKLFYKDKSLAEKCENWCKLHHSCNLEIIKFAVS